MDTHSRRSTLTVALCFIVALIEGLDLQSAGIAAAGLRQAYSLDAGMMGWMFSASIIGLLPGAFFGAGLPTGLVVRRYSLARSSCSESSRSGPPMPAT